MRLLALASCLAIVTVVIASPVLAQRSAPVTLNSCTLEYDNSGSLAAQVSGLRAQFTNDAPKTAHVVNIAADINGTKQIIRDEGTFSTGIEINHRYRVGGGQFALPVVLASIFGSKPTVACSIASVEFTDGSVWSADASRAAASAGQSSAAITVAPSALMLGGIGAAHARIAYASGGGPLALSSDCGRIADVQLLGSTHTDLALRVTPKAAGSCTISLHDLNENLATIPVTVSP